MKQEEITVKINGKGFKKFNKNIRKTTRNVKELNQELQKTVALVEQLRDYQKYEEDD